MNPKLVAWVQRRDLIQKWIRSGHQGPPTEHYLATNSPCVAAFLDPTSSVICSGRITMEHVVPGYGRMGRKAEDREDQMVSLCIGHHLISHAGFIWALGNKPLIRRYLTELYPEEERE